MLQKHPKTLQTSQEIEHLTKSHSAQVQNNDFCTKFLHKPYLIMGILNVTPDSFAEVDHCDSADKAIARGLQLMEEGADIIDIGGESTRPGADEVPVAQELARVLPVLEVLVPRAKQSGVLISIDTRRAAVMETAIRMGVDIVNDVSALQHDSSSLAVVAKHNTPVILMHSRGTPKSMNGMTDYSNVMEEVKSFLRKRCQVCLERGITNIAIDPGLGFAKTVEHNLVIMQNLVELQQLGYPVVVGWSRKRSIDRWFGTNNSTPDRRDMGSIIGALWCLQNGVRIVRVHNVKDTRSSFELWQDLQGSRKI